MINTRKENDAKSVRNRKRSVLVIVLTTFICLSPLHGQAVARAPIDVNLIIDGSDAFTSVRAEVSSWVGARLDQILADGDRVTVWSAGPTAKVVYSGVMSGPAERDAVKQNIRELSVSGTYADFSGALRETAAKQSSSFSYTLLISASPQALTSTISGPHASLLRHSRVEEFTNWRALVVGLNMETRVRRAANAYFN